MHSSYKDRVRVTISLSRATAEQIDELVDGVRIRNRSHAIESLVNETLELIQVKQAVILAGGQQAVKRIPAISRSLALLKQYGIFDIIIAVGYLGERIKKEIGTGEEQGLTIQYSESELGTGGALLQLKNKLKQTFLVFNIDHPVDIDLKNLLKFHREHQPIVTLATRSLRELSGIYVVEPKVFSFIPSGFCMLEETVFHELTSQGKLLSYPILTDYKRERTDKS
ncbi:ribbon-helix-helix protein, CopG family [Patescibacteria group bacterium]|nr:ribbon-helix-helix protein, CopG family [Patescibacteria group bacterium]